MDADGDGVLNGDDGDDDDDGVPDEQDNCMPVYNPEQADADADGQGNACEPCELGLALGADCAPVERLPHCVAVPFDPGCWPSDRAARYARPELLGAVFDVSPVDWACGDRTCSGALPPLALQPGVQRTFTVRFEHVDASKLGIGTRARPAWIRPVGITWTRTGYQVTFAAAPTR
jgi:hypothetical protein